MPLGVTLDVMRKQLRAETGQSLNPLHGVQSQFTQDMILDRQQRELWDAYAWPHLLFSKDVALSSGQSDYSYPVEMPFDQIRRISVATSGSSQWRDLHFGIKPTDIPPAGPKGGTPCQWANKVSVSGTVTEPARRSCCSRRPKSWRRRRPRWLRSS